MVFLVYFPFFIIFLKFRKCHDRGTVRPDDDYFIADVMVAFSNPPGTGQLTLGGNADEEISVGQLQYLNIYRFSKIKLTENNGFIDLTASFSGNSDCTYSISYPLPTNPCWAERITNNNFPLLSDDLTISQETSEPVQFTLGPNPVSNQLNISYQIKRRSKNMSIRIYNIYGLQHIYQPLENTIGSIQLDVSELKNGLYYVVLYNGALRITKKVMKEDWR